jgi:hypothetical protein
VTDSVLAGLSALSRVRVCALITIALQLRSAFRSTGAGVASQQNLSRFLLSIPGSGITESVARLFAIEYNAQADVPRSSTPPSLCLGSLACTLTKAGRMR